MLNRNILYYITATNMMIINKKKYVLNILHLKVENIVMFTMKNLKRNLI